MAAPFSNTSLRVPRGFGNLLEGLAREVLRDQPADIPNFAAGYFTALLQKREGGGLDPAGWGAQLEDRFYNSNAFRASSSVKQSESHLNGDKAGSKHDEDKTAPSPQISSPSYESLDSSKVNVEPQSNMLGMKTDNDSGETEHPAFAPEFSYRGTAGDDICAQELSTKEQTPRNEERISHYEEETDTAGNGTCASDPTVMSTYHGEELQSDSTVKEHHDVSESPNYFLVEDEYLGVLDKDDGRILPGEVSAAGETDTSMVDDDSEMNAALYDRAESNAPAEINDQSISESFDETSADEYLVGETQAGKDVFPETKDVDKSSNLENLDSMSDSAETENFNFNSTSEVNTTDDAIYEDQEEILDRPTDQQDDTRTSRDVDGFDDTFETFGSLTEAGIKEDQTFHSVPTQVPQRASKELPSNDPNEAQVNEELLPHSLSAQESTPATHTAYDTRVDTEATYEERTADSQMDQEDQESGTRAGISHEGTLEIRDEELEQQEDVSQPQEDEDIMDIPLDDPEANKAAAKIQAGFRGHMTRKKLKPDEKPGEEVSSSGDALNSSQGGAAGGSEGVETDDTPVPEQ